jgi:phospholipase/carboxylesterase
MPPGTSLAAVRAPIPEGPGHAWFMNRGIGRPLPESIAATAEMLFDWLDSVQQHHSSVTVLGFNDGMAMAGALILAQPNRFSAAVLLSGTLPWDAGPPDIPGRLAGLPVFWGRDPEDLIIPTDLVIRTGVWLRESSGARLTERHYPGLGHGFSNPELKDVRAFLAAL